MTKEEVKDERRQSDGDPKIKARLRRAYEKIARERSLDAVPTADVVVTNPVHVAVALKYQPGAMGAPTVVAKGAEQMAARIRELARRHGVPIVERRALARALFRSVPIGREIPATLYRAVAEILAYIYGLRRAS
jgi:flagellar biosynthetic protein FlhB